MTDSLAAAQMRMHERGEGFHKVKGTKWIDISYFTAEYFAIRPLGNFLSNKIQKVNPIQTSGIRDTVLLVSGCPAKFVLTSLAGLSSQYNVCNKSHVLVII